MSESEQTPGDRVKTAVGALGCYEREVVAAEADLAGAQRKLAKAQAAVEVAELNVTRYEAEIVAANGRVAAEQAEHAEASAVLAGTPADTGPEARAAALDATISVKEGV